MDGAGAMSNMLVLMHRGMSIAGGTSGDPAAWACPDDVQDRLQPVAGRPGRWVSCLRSDDRRIAGRLVQDISETDWPDAGFSWMVASVLLQNREGA